MKQEDIVQQIHYYSEKASDATQKLAIAGIAIIWIFREIIDNTVSFPKSLKSALILFVISIGINILSYIIMAIVYGIYSLNDDDQEIHEIWTICSWILFIAQFIVLIIGFIKTFIYISSEMLI